MDNNCLLLRNNGVMEYSNEEPNYEFLSTSVGGLIDLVSLPNDIDVFVNDEGILLNMPLSLIIKVDEKTRGTVSNKDIALHGNCVLVGTTDDGDSIPLNENQIHWLNQRLYKASSSIGDLWVIDLIDDLS